MFVKFNFSFYNPKILTNLITKRLFSGNNSVNNSLHKNIYNNELQSKLKTGKITYYDVLQVSPTANKNEIKKAYLRLVKEYHPDVNKNTETRSIFLCIKESHDVLTDRNKRILYDQKLNQFEDRGSIYNKSTILRRSTGYDMGNVPCGLIVLDSAESERWERYQRYTKGERNDSVEDPNIWIKTIGSILISCLTVSIGCLVFGHLLTKFPQSSEVDDKYDVDSVRDEHMVKAYYNPITERWERIIDPFEAPLPEVLISHYKGRVESSELSKIPLKNLTIFQVSTTIHLFY
uniref:Molecular chaperone (DnaJ-like), putative n=1 Tax=Theileria annulata TaxID=5874 RepID=A0A3B0MLY4_THEAN